MNRQIFVYADLDNSLHFVGTLWTRQGKTRESASFEYNEEWLLNPLRFALEPALQLTSGSVHTDNNRSLFGAIGDSAPDRWGRILIQREERRKARIENRSPHTLAEADYLLGVGDITRQGALRFATTKGGEFLAPQDTTTIPPLVKLNELLNAATRICSDEDDDSDLKLLLAPGSSLGGARAKASVIERDGSLAIAKFPQTDDTWSVILWEKTAIDLAETSGISVPELRIEKVNGRNVLILKRFDRFRNNRIPFLSAMSMLTAMDNEAHSYLEIVDAIRVHGNKPEQNLHQLWRRIVFNILISNTDDHLRNHGFLYDEKGWILSPAYDLNPTPTDIKRRILSLAIDRDDATASLELAYSVVYQFGLKIQEAKQIAGDVGRVVKNWRDCAIKNGINSKEINRMESAFEHKDLKLALA
ncbi:MAG: HipA domain-containing protein [Pseudomonadota bacterium]